MRFSTLIGVVVAAATFSTANADDLLEIYKLAQTKDPIILQQKALRDSAYAAIDIADAANLPQINLKGVAQYIRQTKMTKLQLLSQEEHCLYNNLFGDTQTSYKAPSLKRVRHLQT